MKQSLTRSAQAAIVLTIALTLSACATLDAMLAAPTAEVGNSYAVHPSKMFCTVTGTTCSARRKKNFTVDNGAVMANEPVAILRIVFEDGTKDWIKYSAFVQQNFGPPLETRRKVKYDMSPDDIKATWGAPDSTAPDTKYGRTLDIWTYKGIGRITFIDGKVIDVELQKSLPSLE